MRCKGCSHSLWNLTGNICPECGKEFTRAEFEFQPYSVMFKCPSCAQPYYGAGEKGHLVPTAFECTSCHHAIDMESCVLVPAKGREEDAVAVGAPVPWTTEASFFRRLWETSIAALVKPRSLGIAIAAHEPRLKSAMAYFGVVIGILLVISLVCAVAQGGFMMLMMGGLGGLGGGGGGAPVVPGTFLLASQMGPGLILSVGMPLFYGIYIPISAAVAVVLWRILGGESTRESHQPPTLTFVRAVEILLWSSGSLLVTLVPCVGSFASVWWIVSAAIVTSAFVGARLGAASTGKSAWSMVLGMLAPLLLICGGVIAFAMVIAGMGMSSARASARANLSGAQAPAPMVAPASAPEPEPVAEPALVEDAVPTPN